MYQVIHFFTDLQDFNHPYHEGDVFPRAGLKVTEERLMELAGSNNKQHKPLIKLVERETELPIDVDEKKHTKTEINRMSKLELQELAINSGIGGAEEMTGAELKESLISLFGL